MFRKTLKLISLFSLGLVLQMTAGRASAQSNLVLLVCPTGEDVGGGCTYVTTNANDFTVLGGNGGMGAGNGGLQVSAFGYWILADGPNDTPLAVGDYPNAARDSFNGDAPGLDVFGNGGGCDTVCGSFQINEWETHTNGNPIHL